MVAVESEKRCEKCADSKLSQLLAITSGRGHQFSAKKLDRRPGNDE